MELNHLEWTKLWSDGKRAVQPQQNVVRVNICSQTSCYIFSLPTSHLSGEHSEHTPETCHKCHHHFLLILSKMWGSSNEQRHKKSHSHVVFSGQHNWRFPPSCYQEPGEGKQHIPDSQNLLLQCACTLQLSKTRQHTVPDNTDAPHLPFYGTCTDSKISFSSFIPCNSFFFCLFWEVEYFNCINMLQSLVPSKNVCSLDRIWIIAMD